MSVASGSFLQAIRHQPAQEHSSVFTKKHIDTERKLPATTSKISRVCKSCSSHRGEMLTAKKQIYIIKKTHTHKLLHPGRLDSLIARSDPNHRARRRSDCDPFKILGFGQLFRQARQLLRLEHLTEGESLAGQCCLDGIWHQLHQACLHTG